MRETLSATLPSTTPIGPTPERMAKAQVLKPVVDGRSCRRAFEVVDVLSKHAPELTQEALGKLRHYTEIRIGVEGATWALNSYEARVDQGGWGSDPRLDAGSTLHDDTDELARIHRCLGPRLRRAADALVDAVANPRRPCPFESRLGKENVVTTLNSIAEKL